MKKLISLLTALLLLATLLIGCKEDSGASDSGRLFDYKDMSKYITVPEYKGIEVSTDDEDFIKLIADQMASDLSAAGYGEETEIASGTVEEGDTVHIVYVGKHNGEAFSGGSTGDEGADLVIGSGSYIDGFETGLIGAKPGETRVLNLTFPDPYPNNDELSGEEVEFTVTVEKIKRTSYPEITDEIAKALGYEGVDEYNAYAFKTSVENFLYDTVANASEVKSVPEKELEYFVDADIAYYKSYAEAYGYTFEDFLAAYNMDEETFKEQLTTDRENSMTGYLLVYYIAQEEGIEVTDGQIEAEYEALAEQYSMEVDEVKAEVDTKQIELQLVHRAAIEVLYENAEIKE